MRHVKSFSEYLAQGIAKKQAPDKNKAKALREEAQEAYDILLTYRKSNLINDKNANYVIKNAYDIIMELVRAEMSLQGFSTSGKGAHEAEVSFMAGLGFSETELDFADNLRFFRNGILYYGKKHDKEYAEKVLSFVQRVREKVLQTRG